MPLTMAEIGKVSVINRVNGNEETRRFLGNLGFCGRNGSYCIIRDGRKRDREY